MNSNYYITLITSSLNIEDWTDIYRFIDSIYTEGEDEEKQNAVRCLKAKCIGIEYATVANPDVCKHPTKELTSGVLRQLDRNTHYCIIYNKCDDTEDPSGLAQFIKFPQKFRQRTGNNNYLSLVSLIINTNGMMDQEKASRFNSKLNDFFNLLFTGIKPVFHEKPYHILENNDSGNLNLGDIEGNNQVIKNRNEKHTSEISKSDSWLKKIEDKFPSQWQEEKYDHNTVNSPLKSLNLMGVPQVHYCEEEDYQENLDRLYEIRSDLYKGHFEAANSHFRFFVDTESFARRKSQRFMSWLDHLKTQLQSDGQKKVHKLNILITPYADSESDFICAINNRVFDGKAFIVPLDVNNRRSNFIEKSSYLKYLDKDSVKYHYVDHILFTGETYQRTKSFLHSIICSKESDTHKNSYQEDDNLNNHLCIFDSIITVINNLSFAKGQEIKNDVIKKKFFSFINLYYPSSRLDGGDCELCILEDYYKDLNKKTVLENCQAIILTYLNKIKLKNIKEITQDKKNRPWHEIKRNFIRLIMTHEFCFRISQIAWEKPDFFDITRNDISEEFDSIYCHLCNQDYTGTHLTKSNINERINTWFQYDLDDDYDELRIYFNKKLETDKKISFLKVISSPPLSRYALIREYAHHKLLSVLYEIIHKTDNYTYDDMKLTKSVLKSLSFMKSNALVRKEVIVGIWNVLGKVIKNLEKEKTELIKLRNNTQKKQRQADIKNSKSNQTTPNIQDDDIKKRNSIRNCLYYLKKEEENIESILSGKIDYIKDFSRDVQFFIKNAIDEDEAKATFLGELIRGGKEMYRDTISDTKLSIKQDAINDLFNKPFNKPFNNIEDNDIFLRGYSDFLVWLFYDNTTITRKTLVLINKELDNDPAFKFKFYSEEKKELKNISEFWESISDIRTTLENKVRLNDCYSSFRPYLANGDGIDFITKLSFATYAKLKLDDLIVRKHKTSIESDLNALLAVFSEIMGADGAFFAVRKGHKLFPVALYDKDSKQKLNDNPGEESFDYEHWFFNDYYTKRYNHTHVLYPFRPMFNKQNQQFGEVTSLGAHSLNIFIIEEQQNANDKQKNKARATITFLYNKENTLIENEQKFRINIQEAGRLLLLLKNEFYNYVIDYLINEKVFDLWIEKHKNIRKFEKIYFRSNHTFNSVYNEMDEFEKINHKTLSATYKTWFFLTNETISFLYSNIEKNRSEGETYPKHQLKIDEEFIINEENTLGETFNRNFVFVLSCLLDNLWNKDEKEKCTIFINGQDIHDFNGLDKKLGDTRILMHKQLLRTFLSQCLHNSLANSDSGHRKWGETKKVEITISKNEITIQDIFIDNSISEELKEEVNIFRIKKKHIRTMNCDEYSSTTLTTLQGVINYLSQKCSRFQCDYGFNEDNNFYVTIKY